MRQPVAVRGPEPYAEALTGLWRDLELTLARLDGLAARPAALLDPERAARLAPLQYRLHAASEAVLALAPPDEAEAAHQELADALVAAREATAAVTGALEDGETVGPLVYEWRGALFRVRLARLELRPEQPPPPAGRRWARIQALLLLVTALAAVVVGAHASAWFVVGAGVIGVALAVLLLLRP